MITAPTLLPKRGGNLIAGAMAALVAVLAGVGLAKGGGPQLAALGLASMLASAAFARSLSAERLILLAMIVLFLFPFVAAPYAGPLRLVPGLLFIWLLALASLDSRGNKQIGRNRLTLLDTAYAVLVLGLFLSVGKGVQSAPALAGLAFISGGPYLLGRALGLTGHARTVLKAIALGCATVVPFAVFEFATGSNIFLRVPGAIIVESGLGILTERYGVPRVQAAFAQPIPFAMVMATGAICSLTLWGTSKSPNRQRWLWLAIALIGIQALGLARLGWSVLLVAGAVGLLLRPRALATKQARGIVALALVFLTAASMIGPTRALLFGSETAEGRQVDSSSAYRTDLVEYVLDKGLIETFGTTAQITGPGGVVSIDNEYLVLALQWGVVPALGLALVAIGIVAVGWRLRSDPIAVGVAAAAVPNFVLLFGVAMLSQQEVVAWLLAGLCSGIACSRSNAALAVTRRQSDGLGTIPAREQMFTSADRNQ